MCSDDGAGMAPESSLKYDMDLLQSLEVFVSEKVITKKYPMYDY